MSENKQPFSVTGRIITFGSDNKVETSCLVVGGSYLPDDYMPSIGERIEMAKEKIKDLVSPQMQGWVGELLSSAKQNRFIATDYPLPTE